MTDAELRELYRDCIYPELDYDVEQELSDWELREIFRPIINQMIADECYQCDIEGFITLCDFNYYMSEITYFALADEYSLDLNEDNWHNSNYHYGYAVWEDSEYFLKVKELNSPKKILY